MSDRETISGSLTPEGIARLEQLKADLETLQAAMANPEGMSRFEIEGRVRAFQDKEREVRQFLRELSLLPDGSA